MDRHEIGANATDWFATAGIEGLDITNVWETAQVSVVESFAQGVPAGMKERIGYAWSNLQSAYALSAVRSIAIPIFHDYQHLADNLTESNHPLADSVATYVKWINGDLRDVPDVALHPQFQPFLSTFIQDVGRVVTVPLGDTVVLPLHLPETTIVVQPVGIAVSRPNPKVDVDTSLDEVSLNWRPHEPTAVAVVQNGNVVAATPDFLQQATADALFGGENSLNKIKRATHAYEAAMVRFRQALGYEFFSNLAPVLRPLTFTWPLASMMASSR